MTVTGRLQFLFPLWSALLLWLGMPGSWSFWPLMFIGLVPFFYVILKAETVKKAVLFGLSFGLFHYLFTLYWIVIVLEKYGGLPLFVAVPALVVLALYMTMYSTACAALFQYVSRKGRADVWLFLLPATWVGFDWLRSFLFSGFPWMDLGYSLWQAPFLIQGAELFGHHLITYMVVLVNVLITQLLLGGRNNGSLVGKGLAMILALLMLPGYSWFVLKNSKQNLAQKETVTIGVVQGNILQNQKWSADFQQKTVEKYLTLSSSIEEHQHLDMLVWPETALPFYPNVSREFYPVADFIKNDSVTLLTGAPWYEVVSAQNKQFNYFNSALLLGENSKLLGKYYKSHLVPYGEYVPLKKYMPFLAPLVETVGDFTPGVIENPLSAEKIKSGILLCYESIFPEIGRAWVNQGANVLVNLTNDAWYGKSSAPYQSFAMVVFRAIETGRSVVRSANTGVSGFIDPLGRLQSASDIFVPWAEKQNVILNDEKTLYVRWGYLFAPFCLFIGLGVALTTRLRT